MRPTQIHFMTESAKLAPKEKRELSATEAILALLANDKKILSRIQSAKEKEAYKRQAFKNYKPHLDGVLVASIPDTQDPILREWLIWSIDAGLLDETVLLLDFAMKNSVLLPERYKRSTAAGVVEEIAKKAKVGRTFQQPVSLDILKQINILTKTADMPDEVRAKLYAEIGYAEKDIYQVEYYFTEAVKLDQKVGVIKALESVKKNIEVLKAKHAEGTE